MTYNDLKSKFDGINKISKDSTLVLTGENTTIKDLTLDGHLVVKDGEVVTGEYTSKNYLQFVPTDETDTDALRIRGYKN